LEWRLSAWSEPLPYGIIFLKLQEMIDSKGVTCWKDGSEEFFRSRKLLVCSFGVFFTVSWQETIPQILEAVLDRLLDLAPRKKFYDCGVLEVSMREVFILENNPSDAFATISLCYINR
tara:strand:- start:3124 stop:3477 length:354 start_codon:yes stop_codon:yes gene_type:complete